MACIELKNVSYQYPLSKEKALDDVNYKFEKGRFYGIIGENGGGKTTLCNLIRGLIPQFYKGKLTGTVKILGKELREWDPAELSSKIGYVFQNPFTQISGIKETVFEEIAMGMENMGVTKEQIIDQVVTICQLLKIEDLIEKNPNELSGGQRQRVAFASIIAMNTDILVIDEPTSQLDPQGTQDIFEIIRMLKKEGKTIFLVEHKINLIAEYCDEVVVMEGGKIVFGGTARGILSNRDLENHGAMIPEAAVLGHQLKEQGIELDSIPITTEEAVRLIKQRIGEEYGNRI
ncbi:energy-coupling factor ABC transporter ATP-binding protein [Faecalicatena fissicatena]|uniref:ABC transporter ATP-binding protein n=1 Tax=Faecalicatena fissicatena TaxID=290055 RepID=A0ABS2EAQ7_9FIRM|nr:ABC transporter ATP-binding protein [Faecalicatena fissicatena]MBM6738728.1 ABC transporter ATP-binding protein [Faecalicatena fissicatena]